MKVIFLDVDGVLNSAAESIWRWRSKGGLNGKYFHRKGISDLKWKILDAIGKFYYWMIHNKLLKNSRWQRRSLDFYMWCFTDHYDWCPIACSNFQFILDSVPDARVVISSVWRSNEWGHLIRIFKRNGIDVSKFIGRTGAWEYGGKERGDQIKAWLDRHSGALDRLSWKGKDLLPDELVENFVVLDDDSDMTAVRDHFVQTNNRNGLSYSDAKRAILILTGEASKPQTVVEIAYPEGD